MKILIIAHAYPPYVGGGAEVSTSLLAEGLVRAGHQVSVLTCSEEAQEQVRNGVFIRRIVSPNIYWSFTAKPSGLEKLAWTLRDNKNGKALQAISQGIKEFQPDIMVTSTLENFGADAWVAAHRSGVPMVHILRNYNIMCANMAMYKNGKNCARACVLCNCLSIGKRRASQYVNGVIGLSSHILNAHLNNGYFKNASRAVVPNFIPEDVVALGSERMPPVVRSPIVFGYLGTLAEHKGIGHLVAAFKAFGKSHPVKLLVAGSGDAEYVARLKEDLAENDAEFLGWMKQDDFFKMIDCLVIPSLWHEPFGRVVLEAFASGVPVIGSVRGGIPEVIRSGYNGFLFEPDDVGSLGSILRRICGNPSELQALAQNAICTVSTFSEALVLPQYIEFFEKVSKESRVRVRPVEAVGSP